jgi:glycolate oxidase iron-sulfur subunit
MQTTLNPEFADTADGAEAAAIVRKCVHCGFCNATCPTYQILGDELDGPRGRIYLIKQVLEGAPPTRSTQKHLDRCLTCLNCETTCPSGVQYGHLVEIGRRLVEERVERPIAEKTVRWTLKEGLTSPAFGAAMRIGQALRPLLPATLKAKLPDAMRHEAGEWPRRSHARKIVMPQGCVQPAMMPNIDRAAARVFDAAGIEVLPLRSGGCCGALRLHLSDHDGALAHMRRNVDAWSGRITAPGVEAIVSSASACDLTIKEYGHALSRDPAYAERAAQVSALTRDLSEYLPELATLLAGKVDASKAPRAVFHPPCTLQHGQKLRGVVETSLRALGFDVVMARQESHLCCGSAGTYSVLQPEMALQLRDRKLNNLAAGPDELILSANVGCIQHLQSGTGTPVKHWIELLDESLS